MLCPNETNDDAACLQKLQRDLRGGGGLLWDFGNKKLLIVSPLASNPSPDFGCHFIDGLKDVIALHGIAVHAGCLQIFVRVIRAKVKTSWRQAAVLGLEVIYNQISPILEGIPLLSTIFASEIVPLKDFCISLYSLHLRHNFTFRLR
jgi:hypothetical protein